MRRALLDVRVLVAAFEAGVLPLEAFDHRAHMAVALAYLEEAPLDEATAKMRAGLQRFLVAHGKTGHYHETVTVFWMRLLDHLARTPPYAALPLDARAAAIAADWAPRKPLAAHYSPEALDGPAREAWVEPDLAPLPF